MKKKEIGFAYNKFSSLESLGLMSFIAGLFIPLGVDLILRIWFDLSFEQLIFFGFSGYLVFYLMILFVGFLIGVLSSRYLFMVLGLVCFGLLFALFEFPWGNLIGLPLDSVVVCLVMVASGSFSFGVLRLLKMKFEGEGLGWFNFKRIRLFVGGVLFFLIVVMGFKGLIFDNGLICFRDDRGERVMNYSVNFWIGEKLFYGRLNRSNGCVLVPNEMRLGFERGEKVFLRYGVLLTNFRAFEGDVLTEYELVSGVRGFVVRLSGV